MTYTCNEAIGSQALCFGPRVALVAGFLLISRLAMMLVTERAAPVAGSATGISDQSIDTKR